MMCVLTVVLLFVLANGVLAFCPKDGFTHVGSGVSQAILD
jgi:hypothetical protein